MNTSEARSRFIEAGRERIEIIGSDRDTYGFGDKEFATIGRLLGVIERDDINADARAFRVHTQEFYEKTVGDGDFNDYLENYFNPGSHGGDEDDLDDYARRG